MDGRRDWQKETDERQDREIGELGARMTKVERLQQYVIGAAAGMGTAVGFFAKALWDKLLAR